MSKKSAKIIRHYTNNFKLGNINIYILGNNQDFDFRQYYLKIDQAELCTRILASLAYAKILFKIIEQSIKQYETEYETIKDE